MKKAYLGVAIIIAIIFLSCGQYDPESDFRVETLDNGRSIRIVEYVGDNLTVRIPPRINRLPVTHIGARAFAEKNLISVTIPNSVRVIASAAFANNRLTSVIIVKCNFIKL